MEEKLVKFGIYREMCVGSLYQFINEPEKSKPEHGCGEVELFELSSNSFNYWELMIFYSYRKNSLLHFMCRDGILSTYRLHTSALL